MPRPTLLTELLVTLCYILVSWNHSSFQNRRMNSAALLALLALLTSDSVTVEAAKLPATFKLCKKNDPNIKTCLETAIEQAIREMKPGIPALHLLPFDPLNVPRITIKDSSGRPVNLNIDFSDVKCAGLSESKIKNLRFDPDSHILGADAIIPHVSIDADYEMDGNFLVLPVKGRGKCKFDFTGMNGTMNLIAEAQTKNGKSYWNVVKNELHITGLAKMRVIFDDLFNGDKTLGDSTNNLLNENWEQFWDELRPSIEETFAAVFMSIANAIFSRVPEHDIFLE